MMAYWWKTSVSVVFIFMASKVPLNFSEILLFEIKFSNIKSDSFDLWKRKIKKFNGWLWQNRISKRRRKRSYSRNWRIIIRMFDFRFIQVKCSGNIYGAWASDFRVSAGHSNLYTHILGISRPQNILLIRNGVWMQKQPVLHFSLRVIFWFFTSKHENREKFICQINWVIRSVLITIRAKKV